LQRALLRYLTVAAEKAGRADLLQLWAGQSASLSRYEDVNTLLNDLAMQVSVIGERVQRSFC
jgi:nitronate monooxygenase